LEVKYKQEFDDLLSYVHQATLWHLWGALIRGALRGMSTRQKLEIMKRFFAYAISKNTILEYDNEAQCAVFSGDRPEVVAERILADFPIDKLPEYDVEPESDFFIYAIQKQNGWVGLLEGTFLTHPG